MGKSENRQAEGVPRVRRKSRSKESHRSQSFLKTFEVQRIELCWHVKDGVTPQSSD